MKKLILSIAFFTLIALKGFSQTTTEAKTIDIKDIAKHSGEKVTICDQIYGGRVLDGPDITLLDLGGEGDKSLITLVIMSADKAKFKTKPEETFKGKKACVTGTIGDYQGRPIMNITDPEQIKVQ